MRSELFPSPRGRSSLPRRCLLALWLVVAAYVFWLRTDPYGDLGMRNSLTFIALAVGALASLVWFLLASHAPRRRKRWVLLLTLTSTGLAALFVRIEGFSGTMIPFLSLRAPWSPAPPLVEVPGISDSAQPLAEGPGDFPGFLGPRRDGRVDRARLARSWDEARPTMLWSHTIGAGWSGFAIVDGVAVTMEERGDSTGLFAYQLESGEPLWSNTWRGTFFQVLAGAGPRCTPAIAAGRVYAQDARGRLVCVNAVNGAFHWEHDLMSEFGVSLESEDELVLYGRASSPLVSEDRVILSAGGMPGGRQAGLVAFDAESGQLLWEGPPRQLSYASANRALLAGRDQLLIVNEGSFSGHDPRSGSLLWEHPWPSRTAGNAAASQAVAVPPDMVFCSKGYGLGSILVRLVPDAANGLRSEQLWANRRLLRTKFTNVVTHEGHAYGLSDGIMECVELETGQRVWKSGRHGHGQILACHDLILVLSEQGELLLIEASPQGGGAALGRIQVLSGQTWNNMALSGDVLLVRNGTEAAAWRLPLDEL